MTELPSYILNYFDELNNKTAHAYAIAQQARAQGYDPDTKPEVQIAKNMAERVAGLVSVLAPQIVGSGVVERIQELEQQYGVLDWRVACQAALEVAQQKFCTFEDEREAIEVGIRVGFSYVTNGVVSSPLEGFVKLEIAERQDRTGKFFRIYYAGPVRNAGGTAAATSAIIADYVRKHMGYAVWDPTEDEILRCYTELGNYHDRIANLQFYPSQKEIEFLLKNMPIDVAGDPTEKIEVSNYKNLPRVTTNKLRAGYCLMFSGCIPLKAPKLWKQLSKWGDEMGMEQWNFLEQYIKIQKEESSKSASSSGEKKKDDDVKIKPNFTYIKDLVAGRPVFAHPLRPGGFRLRYGRSRLSGFSAQALHPATMIIANEFIATASQLKVERPGKAAAYTVCDRIEGPIVRLTNGNVIRVTTTQQAKQVKDDVEKILYLGDALCNYGDFLDRAHVLLPPGYCEEWWVQELKQAGCDVPQDLWQDPSFVPVSFEQALAYSKEYSVPLHPRWTYFYTVASVEQLRLLWEAIRKAPHGESLQLPPGSDIKTVLEVLGVPHSVTEEHLVVHGDDALALKTCFSREAVLTDETPADFMAHVSPMFLKDKAGVFIGSRLGRPEKAKMRKLTGSPHALFPCGTEGGRLRSITEAYEKGGRVTAAFELFHCNTCDAQRVTPRCPECSELCEERFWCKECGTTPRKECPTGILHYKAKHTTIDMAPYFKMGLKRMQSQVYPELIKGVRGTMNEDHATEHLFKGMLRARHEIHVNKDGTIRYDASEVPITHFRPSEVGLTVEKCLELGYEVDIHNKPITAVDQVIEMFPQDVVLPACDESPDEASDDVLLRVTQFVDELLQQLYGLEPYYNATKPEDLIGHFVVALAPHTSAGTIGRILGFTKTQGLFYHPYLHAATRRDCDGDEGCVFLMMDAFLNFSRRYLPSSRGGTMDAPLVLTTVLEPAEVDDMVLNMDITDRYDLDFYKACNEYKMPWEAKVKIVNDVLGKPGQWFGMGFTHDTTDMNDGNRVSSYKTLPSMQEKLASQMQLAEKLKAVDERDVARLVIEKHFIRDLKGNLRKFSQQVFRCVKCNEKFRRPPLRGNCNCGGRIIFTISEGSVVKYLTPSESLVQAYNLDLYLAQTIELTRRRIEEVFGKDPEKQLGLGEWF